MRYKSSTKTTLNTQRGLRCPSWITDELIADTISTWQPHYDFELTEEDAIQMLMNVGRLFDLLEADHAHPRPGKQPRH
jgi:hypothetical protein